MVRNQPANFAISFKYFDGPYNAIGSGESPVSFLAGKVAVPSSKLTLDSGENWIPTASHGTDGTLDFYSIVRVLQGLSWYLFYDTSHLMLNVNLANSSFVAPI